MPDTPKPMGLRARYKALEKFNNMLKLNSEHATICANAGFWKLGLTNRDQCKALVAEYMAHMTSEIAKIKEKGSFEVMDNFLKVDPSIAAKVAEHIDDDSSE